MQRSDWLLLLLGAPTRDEATPPLDPVRIMKGLFLLIEEGNLDDGPGYDFQPYHYGPVSLQIYDDLDQLVNEGLVDALPVSGYSWAKYRLSEAGCTRFALLDADLSTRVRQEIIRVKEVVSRLPFRQLLRFVYSKYPEYATNSVIGRL